MTTTFEEASKCPRCGQPGEKGAEIPAPPGRGVPAGAKLLTIWCRNGNKAFSEDCRWFNTSWLVQVNPDGSVPPPSDHKGEPKEYVGDFGSDEEAQRIRNQLEEERLRQQNPGNELRSPWG
jgi:hypothetical protein